MDKSKVKLIATEAAELYFRYNCTAEQAIKKAIELRERKEREENEMKRCFEMLCNAVKGEM